MKGGPEAAGSSEGRVRMYRTGDLARLSHGALVLHVLGRIPGPASLQLKVEAVVTEHPLVLCAAAAGRTAQEAHGMRGGTEGSRAEAGAASILLLARRWLPAYMCLLALPLNDAGKPTVNI
ncbi:hypothetical protein T492DRAFT_885044 [Pavlovales sp. CCMP2436]|nr:hypothetical protein T492DRAFT_885044 [Pavlovales sp. CCMP2436]